MKKERNCGPRQGRQPKQLEDLLRWEHTQRSRFGGKIESSDWNLNSLECGHMVSQVLGGRLATPTPKTGVPPQCPPWGKDIPTCPPALSYPLLCWRASFGAWTFLSPWPSPSCSPLNCRVSTYGCILEQRKQLGNPGDGSCLGTVQEEGGCFPLPQRRKLMPKNKCGLRVTPISLGSEQSKCNWVCE